MLGCQPSRALVVGQYTRRISGKGIRVEVDEGHVTGSCRGRATLFDLVPREDEPVGLFVEKELNVPALFEGSP